MVSTEAIGYVCALILVLGFGSNFVPTKQYKTGDGIFFTWVLTSAILFCGILVYVVECGVEGSCPSFQPLAMLGGVIWACGNIWVVPIVKLIGLGLGLCIWGSSNMLIGWATGRFGLFGLTPQDVSHSGMNYGGVVVAIGAMIAFLFITPTISKVGDHQRLADDDTGLEAGLLSDATKSKPRIDGTHSITQYADDAQDGLAGAGAAADKDDWADRLNPVTRRLLGIVLSLGSGLCYGSNFTPPTYIVDHTSDYPGSSKNLVDYVLPHFCGIWLTSTFFLIVYCAVMRNKPTVYPEVILPAFFSGVIWSIAQIAMFFANAYLSMVIVFPLATVGPALVGTLWGTCVFREVRGRRNYAILTVAFCLVIAAALIITMSK